MNKQPGAQLPGITKNAWGGNNATMQPPSASIQPVTTGITPTPSMYQGMASWQTPSDMVRQGGMGGQPQRQGSGMMTRDSGQGRDGLHDIRSQFGQQFQPMMDAVRQGAGPWGQAFMASHQPQPQAPAAPMPPPMATPPQANQQAMGAALMGHRGGFMGRRY